MSSSHGSLHKDVSVMGSFPRFSDDPEALAEYWLGVQKRARVDYPSFYNLEGPDMVGMFLGDRNVSGFRRKDGKYELVDVPRVSGPVQHGYLDFLSKAAEKIGYKPKGWTIPVTGPFTLSQNIFIEIEKDNEMPVMNCLDRKDIIKEISDNLLGPIVEHYDRAFPGGIIRLDEPIAARGTLTGDGPGQYGLDNKFIRETLDGVLAKVKNNIPGVHVCGDISSISIVLSQLSNARLLSHDFSGSMRSQLNSYRAADLEEKDMVLGIGLVSTDTPDVEEYSEMQAVYNEARKRFGAERVHLHPACGFGPLMKSSGLPLKDLTKRIAGKLSILDRLRKH